MPAAPAADDSLFSEQQGFLRPWWWLLLPVMVLPLGFTLFMVRHQTLPLVPKLVLLGLAPILLGLFAWLRLDTRVSLAGISYRMRPLSWRHLTWAELTRAYVREYSPISEYGGWGIKGASLKNYAFNVSGSQGLQLELADGRRILLGTRRPVELQQAVDQARCPAAS